MIGAIILGIGPGFLGRALMPGKHKMNSSPHRLGACGRPGWIPSFTELLGIGDNEAFDLGSLIGAVIGVMLLLGVGRALQREKPDRRTERRRRKAFS